MKASISFPELQELLLEKTKQAISLAFIDEKTAKVTYPLNLGIFKKDISANLIIKELKGSNLLLQIEAGLGTETLVTTAFSLLKGNIPDCLIERMPDNHLMVHLDQIEQVKAVFEKVDVRDIHVLSEGLEVEGALKKV